MVDSSLAPGAADVNEMESNALCLVKLIVKRPILVSYVISLVTLAMLAITILVVAIPGDALFTAGGPSSDSNDIRTRHYNAYSTAKTELKFENMGAEMKYECG